jgi:asparagine synthase (glutamine-hydrolysing)
MCGIAGIIGSRAPLEANKLVRRMTRSLARRGPDSEGLEEWPGAILGHRRLAVLDLSPAGHQPMLSEDGQTGVVFNGCIYNFRELRRELEAQGEKFRSDCDTEVLLRGYCRWGIDKLVARLHGMFAFGVWDNRRRSLSLARDQLGVKPLAYCAGNGSIAFASTIGGLEDAGFGGEIDEPAVLEFLNYGFISDAHAIFKGIRKLPPATILEWEDGRVSERRYWRLPEPGAAKAVTFEEAVEETERLLLEAVRLRLVSDVPVAALLSGGIDSALICWALTRLNANIKAFTVGLPGDSSDETRAARESASRLGIAHEVVEFPPDRNNPLEEILRVYSEPFACGSAHGMLAISQAVKEHATVLLTGDGGDDVFLGYPLFRNARLAQLASHFLPQTELPIPRIRPLRPLRNFLNCATQGLPGYIGAREDVNGWLGERLIESTAASETHDSAGGGNRLLGDVFDYHLRMHFTGEFMVKVDGATMHHGLEARSPLLDQGLWEFASALPFSTRLHRWRLKAILREICRRRVGPQVAARPKQGFVIPVERWLAERWTGNLQALKGGTLLAREGWVRPGALESAVAEAEAQRAAPAQLWYLAVLEHWLAARQPAARAARLG